MHHTAVLLTVLAVLSPAVVINSFPLDSSSPAADIVARVNDQSHDSYATRLEGITRRASQNQDDSTRPRDRRAVLLGPSDASEREAVKSRAALARRATNTNNRNHPPDPPGCTCIWRALYFYNGQVWYTAPPYPPAEWEHSSDPELVAKFYSQRGQANGGPSGGWTKIGCSRTSAQGPDCSTGSSSASSLSAVKQAPAVTRTQKRPSRLVRRV